MKISSIGVDFKNIKSISKSEKTKNSNMKNPLCNNTFNLNNQNFAFLGKYTNDFQGIPLLKQTTFLNKGNIDYTMAIKSAEKIGWEKLAKKEDSFRSIAGP